MNRMELLDKLISELVVFITTIIAPNIISNFIKDNLFIYLSKNLHLLNTLSSQVFYILESSNEEHKR